MSKIIPDISHWQGDVDFEKMKDAGASAVIFKASQYYEDKNYKANVAGVKGILPYAAYHYYDNTIDPNVQAQKFASVLDGTEKFLIADYEDRLPGDHSGWKKLYTFLVKLQELVLNKKIVIYSTYYYWKENSPQAFWQKSSLDWFSQFKFWYAAYNTRTWVEQLIPKPWTHEDTLMWQHTDKGDGVKYGVSSLNIDLNHWTGTEEEFVEYFGEEEIPEPPPVDEPPTEETTVIITYQSDNPVNFIFVDANVTPPEPPAPIPVEMQLVRKAGKEHCVINQNASTETQAIHLDFIEGATVLVLPVPEFRIMKRPDGTTHKVPNWKSTEERDRIQKFWRFLIIQKVVKSNGNEKELHTSWTDDGSKGNWDTMGSYILLEYLREIGVPPVEPVEEYPMDAFLRKFYIPDNGDFKRIGHDFESAYWNYEPRSSKVNLDNNDSPPTHALSDTAKPKFDRFNALSPEWQWFIRDLNWYFAPHYTEAEINELIGGQVFSDTVFGFDNHAAQNGYENVITGENTGSSKGYIQMKELGFGGNILHVLEDNNSEIVAEAFDPAKPPPTVEEALRDFPHLLMSACQSTCYKNANEDWDGIHNAKPMPHLRMADGTKIGYMYPFIAENGSAIFYKKQLPSKDGGRKSNELYDIENGTEYTPYIKR